MTQNAKQKMRSYKFERWFPIIEQYKMAISYGDVVFWVYADPPGKNQSRRVKYIPDNRWSGCVYCVNANDTSLEIFELWTPTEAYAWKSNRQDQDRINETRNVRNAELRVTGEKVKTYNRRERLVGANLKKAA